MATDASIAHAPDLHFFAALPAEQTCTPSLDGRRHPGKQAAKCLVAIATAPANKAVGTLPGQRECLGDTAIVACAVVAGAVVADIHKPLSILAHIAVFAGIVYTVAQTVLFFVFGPEQRSPPAQLNVARPASAVREEVPIDRVAALHLFGRPSARPTEEAVQQETLKDTRLSLELVGVFVADQADGSAAIIARKGARAKRFRIGESVLDGAKLSAVFADRVVISRGGVRENLRFDKTSSFVSARRPPTTNEEVPAAEAEQTESTMPVVSNDALPALDEAAEQSGAFEPDSGELLKRLEEDIVAHPEGGYTLGAAADRPELSHTGLQRGDRILSVNGKAVGDLQDDRLQIANILALGSASIEVQRGERRFVVTVALN